MQTHIVLAHPERESFNAHLWNISQQTLGAAGSETSLSDLYAMDFDPREGPHHYDSRKDAKIFHAQTEQRYNNNQCRKLLHRKVRLLGVRFESEASNRAGPGQENPGNPIQAEPQGAP